jgi:hypothetical protein
MVRLAKRLFTMILLTAPLVVGCGESSSNSRDANTPDTAMAGDTGYKPDWNGDTAVPSDTKPVLPDAGTDQIPLSPDTTPAKPDVTVDTPTTDASPVTPGDAPADRAADVAGDGAAASEAGVSDAGATD